MERDKLGWCTHPLRQDSSDVRILVRSGELRCRDDWGSDLWCEKGSVDKVLDVAMHEAPDSIRKPPRDTSDRLVAEARPSIVAAPSVGLHSSQREESSDATAHRVTNEMNSELVKRAQQQFRIRQQSKGYSVEAPPERAALVISNDYIPPSGQEARVDGLVRFADRAASDATFHQVPEVEPDTAVPFRPRIERRPPPSTDDYENISICRIDESTMDPRPRPEQHTDVQVELTELQPSRSDAPDSWSARAVTLPDPYRPSGNSCHWQSDDEADIVSDDLDRTEFLGEGLERDWHGTSSEDPVPLPYSLWINTPVCCHTCRDFRPASDGGRGWCNNKWAFKHRRMVDADECPCETSIGHWWLPVDGAWQGEPDLTVLGEPTPLMDKYFGRPGVVREEELLERRRRRSRA